LEFYKNNLANWFLKATDNQVVRGYNWYKDTNKLAHNFAFEFSKSEAQIAGMLSVLSVGVRWERNVIDTYNLLTAMNNEEVVHTKSYTTYKSQLNKAIAIAELREEDEIERVIGKGLKTLAFFRCIMEPSARAVVVDRWICRASGYENKNFPKEKTYLEIAQYVKELADENKFAPPEMQAIIWLSIKENNE
jgi:hypothetical protein